MFQSGKLFRLAFGAAIASTLVWSTSASAAFVTVTFGPIGPQSIPALSPWMTALLAAMLAVTAAAFLRKRLGSGVFMLMLSIMVGGVALKAENSTANIIPVPTLTLVTSPAVSPDLSLSCSASTLNIVATVPAVINSISADQGWTFVDAASTCHAGTQLNVNGQCAAVFTSLVCTPPVTTAGPVITAGPTETTATVSVTIDKNGTGYYLLLPAASPAPSVAAVQGGTSFAMTGGTPAAINLTGLTLSTAYKLYFVAKDAANNVQAAVQSVNVTTTGDTTPPNAPTLGLNGGNAYINSTTVPLAITGDTDNVGVTGWFVSESSSAPALGSFGAKPATATISSGDGLKTLYVRTRDAAGNVSAPGSSTITLDTTYPTITSLPSWAGGVASGSTTAKTVTFGDTAGGSPQAISITADSGASITGFAGAYGARSFNLVAPVGPATVTIAYSVTDNAGNVTSTTQSVTVAAVNTAPTATDATFDGGLAAQGTFDLTAHIADAQDPTASLTVIVVSGPTHGTLVWNTNTSFTYMVTSGYNGNDSFTYKVRDTGGLESTVRTVSLTNFAN